MKQIRFILFIVLLVFCQHIEAQTITGYVFDANDGEPIMGATVLNGGKGCVTDVNGKFVITGKSGDKLTFKYLGCSDKKVSAQNNMEVGMGKGSYKKMKRTPSSVTTNTSTQTTNYSKPATSSYSSNAVRTKKKDKDTGVKWTEVLDGNSYGIEINNQVIVPCKYNRITFEGGYFIAGLRNGNTWSYACYTQDGRCVISENRGYSAISYYSNDPYIKVYKSGKCGACNINGNEIISPSLGYEYISFEKKTPNLCRVEKGKCYGIYDIQHQKEIINPNKYDKLWIEKEAGTIYFDVRKNGKRGICVASGKEVISPQYDYITYYSYGTPQFRYKIEGDSNLYDTGWDINGNMVAKKNVPQSRPSTPSTTSSSSTYSSSNSSSSSSSTYSSSSSSSYGRLLFSGYYTDTGVMRAPTFTAGSGQPNLYQVKVYENAMLINNQDPRKYLGDGTVFGVAGRMYGYNELAFMFCTANGDLSFVVLNKNNAGVVTDLRQLLYDKGDTRTTYSGKPFSTNLNGNNFGNNSGNYNNYNNYNNNTNNRQHSCRTCHGTGRCPNCNGTKLVANAYTRRNELCNVCHKTGLCPTCNGTGNSPYRH